MFNGIIEEMGTITSITENNKIITYEIKSNFDLSNIKIGESIATNGVCLTVTKKTSTTYFVDAMPETMQRTNFKQLKIGNKVNLERSLRVGDRVSGHFMWGHVDTTTTITNIEDRGDSKQIHLKIPAKQKNLINTKSIGLMPTNLPTSNNTGEELTQPIDFKKTTVEKGTITLNGVSLTVSSINKENNTFTVDLIPETLNKTTFGSAKKGDQINLEVDMIARYAQTLNT